MLYNSGSMWPIPKSLPSVSSNGPLKTSKKRYTSVPISRNESSGPELVKHQQRVSTTGRFDQKDIGAVAKKDEKPKRRTGKDKELVQKKKKKDSRSVTLICGSIAKHIKSLKRCTLQPFPGADIRDIIYFIYAEIVKVNYDIIIIHVGTNNVCNNKLADFDLDMIT